MILHLVAEVLVLDIVEIRLQILLVHLGQVRDGHFAVAFKAVEDCEFCQQFS